MELCHGVKTFDIIELHRSVRRKSSYLLVKRVFDVVVSVFLLTLVSPILLIAIFLIYIDSPGRVLYTQMRCGQNSKNFKIYKLRTMAERKNEAIISITRVGKYLRKFSIDELPQLFNIIIGDMSLVGPRPLAQRFISPNYWLCGYRDMVKPGITGLWQVKARKGCTSIETMLNYDVEYIKNLSFIMDLKIVLVTIPIVIFGLEEV